MQQAVRVLFFHEQSAALSELLKDNCNGITVAISVTDADERSGALGVVRGSHRAYPPIERPRKVVYTGCRQPLMPEDIVEEVSVEKLRAARAQLTNVQDLIADAGTGTNA